MIFVRNAKYTKFSQQIIDNKLLFINKKVMLMASLHLKLITTG